MKKTITITVHNRPHLLRTLLKDLVRNYLVGWDIFLSVEPTREREEAINVIEEILSDIDHEIILPNVKQGVRDNPFGLLSYVYDEIGSDVNIYLEEDIVISPDITKIADWYMTLPRDAYNAYAGISLCNKNSLNKDYSDKDSQSFFVDSYNWSALGFIVDKQGWRDQLKFNWHRDDHHLKRRGWDYSVQAHISWHGLKWLIPEISRSTHVGKHGTHCNPSIQKRLNFDSIVYVDHDISHPEYFLSNHNIDEINNMCIVVPYRDREHHIDPFIHGMSKHMDYYHPEIGYEIHLIEQSDDKQFNRAKLLNIGYNINKHSDCYFCFHDIDLIPEGRCCDYSSPNTPVHLSAFCSQFRYELPYKDIFGGVTLFDKLHFEKVNGYSNEYWGWGGEDDDMKKRMDNPAKLIKQRLVSSEAAIIWHRRNGRFLSLDHPHARDNKAHQANIKKLRSKYDFGDDGLNTLDYDLIESITHDSYTIHRVKV